MQVKKIRLKNFRNYRETELPLYNGINVFSGSNAQGKTNLLEAVYYCATGRSFRTSDDKECILSGQDEALIELSFETGNDGSGEEEAARHEEQIELHFKQNGRKGLKINHYPARRLSELFGRFHVVVFSPEDLSLVKNGPALRRRFMDMEICQVDPVYLSDLQRYYQVLRQRNQLLKDASRDHHYVTYQEKLDAVSKTLFAWNAQLCQYGTAVIRRRETFLKTVQTYTAGIHHTLSHGEETLTLSYDRSVPADEAQFSQALEKDLERDIRNGLTTSGPQHDDFSLFINGANVRNYGSQGQQRTAALSLKLAELQMMKSEIRDTPVLLLDDVMSELDEQRQKQLAGYIKDSQTLLTCTGIEDSIRSLPSSHIFTVAGGTITDTIKESKEGQTE